MGLVFYLQMIYGYINLPKDLSRAPLTPIFSRCVHIPLGFTGIPWTRPLARDTYNL